MPVWPGTGVVIQAAPSPNVRPAEPAGTVISAITLFSFGSMRETTPLGSLTTHTLPPPTAIPPSLAAGPTGIVASSSLVTIDTREMVLSPQFGTQMLSNPAAKPEHGRLPTVIAFTTVLVFGSSRCSVPLGPFDTHTASSVTTCQSGTPSTGNTPTGVMVDISRFTPGVDTPGRGGRLAPPFFGASAAGCCGGASCANVINNGTVAANTNGRSVFIDYSASVANTRLGSIFKTLVLFGLVSHRNPCPAWMMPPPSP